MWIHIPSCTYAYVCQCMYDIHLCPKNISWWDNFHIFSPFPKPKDLAPTTSGCSWVIGQTASITTCKRGKTTSSFCREFAVLLFWAFKKNFPLSLSFRPHNHPNSDSLQHHKSCWKHPTCPANANRKKCVTEYDVSDDVGNTCGASIYNYCICCT